MSTVFEQKVLNEFASIHTELAGIHTEFKSVHTEFKSVHEELADIKGELAETKTAVEVNREQIAVNTQKLDAHETRFMHMDLVIMDIRATLKNHDRQFEKLHEGQNHILNVIDSFLGE
ncbi:MAG: hypothetical protein AAB570_00975, partial [Patescibacteria group bacterium]